MPDTPLEAPFALNADEVAERLETRVKQGLGDSEITERRKAYGPNRLRQQERKGAFAILVHQFRSIIVWLLAAAAAFSLAIGDIAEGIAIVVVLIINGAIGFFTELRAARSMESLLRLAQVSTKVRRDGAVRQVDARELVPGDIVILEAGDVVTADLRLTRASNLQTDESVLTGESTPVVKDTGSLEAETEIGDRRNMAFKGTAITQGSGEGIVTSTGMDTEIGRISELAQKAEAEVSPLERRLDRLGHRLVWMTLALAVLIIGAGVIRGNALTEMIQTGVALAVAAVPEGLPVVATLCLARGMWRMAARNALITKLSSVETLGATTIILADKTGTLTENRMTAVRYLLEGGDFEVDQQARDGLFKHDQENIDLNEDDPLGWALKVGALCNNAELGDGSDNAGSGDPMEIALLAVADKADLGRASVVERYRQVDEHPFDPQRKMMATVHEQDARYLYAVKGAPEAVIEISETVLTGEGSRDLDDEAKQAWNDRNAAAAREGLRLLALAIKHTDGPDDDPYEGLTLIGLVCLLDPLREDVPAAIEDSLRAGVRVVMLTGDHADTAAKIARDAGLGNNEMTVLQGSELADFDPETADEDTRRKLLSADVFARVSPETKLTLAALYQQSGHVVMMTGDGVNDAPALKKADVGVAMGRRGTQVAREVADMVLKDDAFETIVSAIRQGRAIFDNIRKFVVFLLSCNVSEVLVVGLAVGAGLPAPLLPLQILYLNLVTDVFPAFALGFGRGGEGIMRRPPRDPGESIVDWPRWQLIGMLGAAITVATLVAFALALFWFRLESASAVTVAFLTLALAQLWNVFNMRLPETGPLRNEVTRNGYVWGALALCVGLVASALWLPGLSDLLGLPPPGTPALVVAVGLSFVPLAVGQLLLATPAVASGLVGPGDNAA